MPGSGRSHRHGATGSSAYDKKTYIHAINPQLLNEMIEYADEHDIKRSKDMVIRKVITEQGEVCTVLQIKWRIVIEFYLFFIIYLQRKIFDIDNKINNIYMTNVLQKF